MRNFTLMLIACLMLPAIAFSQKKVIVAIGSSTIAGYGASVFDSSWVGRSRAYYIDHGEGPVSVFYDLGQSGAATAAGMPTGTRGTPGQYDTSLNITAAMNRNPDVVIIGYPSNDILYDTPVAAYLSNLRYMYNLVTSAGKVCYITTTQPRTTFDSTQTANLKVARDSILLEFGPFALNFYDQLIIPGTTHFDPALMFVDTSKNNSRDTVHPNDAGHALLFNVVKNNVVLPGSTLPLTLTGFGASLSDGAADIQWTSVNEQGTTAFQIQKSADGQNFTTVHEMDGKGSIQSNSYSWIDEDPLSGTSYYRLHITETGKQSYSQIASVNNKKLSALITKMFIQNGNSLYLELNLAQNGPVDIGVFSSTGVRVVRQRVSLNSLSATTTVPIGDLSAGVYFLKILTADGGKETKAFSKF